MSYFSVLIVNNMDPRREGKKIGSCCSAKYINALEILSGRNEHICSYIGSKLQICYQISTKYFASTYLCSLCSTKIHVSVSKTHR